MSGTSNNDGYWGNAWQTSFSLSWITDNKFTVKVTATDVAGNVATKEWTIDVTAPVCTSLEIENKNQTTGYAKAGDVIKVSVAFNEELVSNPIIKVNNILADVSIIEGKYVGEVEMKADMKQGEIEISVDEYKDDSENLGLELTNDNITGDVKSIILDTIKPVINFDENKASGTIMDTNLDKYLGRILKGTVNDHIDTFAWLKDPEVKFDFSSHGDGVYTIEAYDKAGNVTIEKITQGVVPSSIKVHPVGTMLKQGAQEAQKNVEETEQVKKTEGNLISDNKETTMENEQEETKTNKDSKEEVIENLKGNEEDKSLNKTENVLEELDKKLND